MSQATLNMSSVPPPNLNELFVEEVKAAGVALSSDPEDRVFRSHGNERTKMPWLVVSHRTLMNQECFSWNRDLYIHRDRFHSILSCPRVSCVLLGMILSILQWWNSALFLHTGHCLHEIYALREGRIGRIPDLVVWPSEYFEACVCFHAHMGAHALLWSFDHVRAQQGAPEINWISNLLNTKMLQSSSKVHILILSSG